MRRSVALLLLVPTIGLQAATVTSAEAVLANGFEIDGNVPDTADPGIDWGSLSDADTHATDPVGNVDLSTFGVGSKEFEHPSTWVQKTGLAPNQDDISDVYFHNQTIGDDVFGYFAFRRLTTSGTTNYDVEFNQADNISANPARPTRTVDDLMVRFEQDGSDAFQLTFAYRWALASDFNDFPMGCLAVTGYSPAAGWCKISIAAAQFTGATGESGHFAEGTLNLSSFFEGADCRGGFGTANVRSFTGNSDSSSLKDYVEPFPINVPPTCGALTFQKRDQFGNLVGGATYKITPNPVPGVQNPDFLVIADIGTGAGPDADDTNDADTRPGFISVNPAEAGDYVVIELTAPPGYSLDPNPVNIHVDEQGVGEGDRDFLDKRFFPPLSIDNTADATKAVQYNWDILKSVDGADTQNVPQGTDATFDYDVTLRATGVTFSGHEVHGTVDITNPDTNADFSMVATLEVTGAGGAACTVDAVDLDDEPANGLQVLVPTSDLSLDYTCPPGSGPGDTTATITWDSGQYPQDPAVDPTPDYSDTDTDGYTFVIPPANSIDESVDVTDAFNAADLPGAPTATDDLGTVTWDPAWDNGPFPIVAGTYSYPRTVTGVPGTCTTYDNTATVTGSDSGVLDTADAAVTVCVGKDLTVTKDANLGFQRELLWDIAKGGPGTVFTGEDEQGNLQRMVRYTIDITADGMTDSEWALTGTIEITNPNDWNVTGTVTDTVVVDEGSIECDVLSPDEGGAAGHQLTIAGDSTETFDYECNGVQQGDYVGNNTVTFDYSADSHEYPDVDDTASKTVPVEVTGDPEPANSTVTITDLLDNTDVTDALPQTEFVWATVHGMPNHTQRINYDVVLDTTAGACTPHLNTVTIDQTGQNDDHTVIVCSPGVAKTVEASFGQKRLWDITKEVDKTDVEISQGGTATFNYTVTVTPLGVVDDGEGSWEGTVTVTNPSDTEGLTVDVTDLPDVEGWTCEFTDDATQVAIAAGGSAILDYTCDGEGHPSGTNTAEVSFADDQTVSKTVDVDFEARADIRDSVISVYDDKTNPDAPPVLLGEADAADGPTEFTYSLVKAGVAGECTTYNNTAVAVLEASDDPDASAEATLCVEKPLTIVTSASGNYGVTYPWGIDKDVDQTRVEVGEDGEATFNYTVTVTAGEAQPAGWTLSGDIDVTNPNTYAGGAITLTGATVTTDIGGGADCTATLPDNPVVPVDGSISVPFDCTFTGEPATSGEVHAEVTWDPAGPADSATAEDDGPATLTVGEEVNKVVDVIDDKTDPSNPVLLEEGLEWSDGLVKEYEYALSLPGTAGTCVDYTNTAIVDLTSGTDPEAQQTVTVCEEAPLGAAVTASADLARAYAWSIDKVVDATTRTVDASGNATFRYTVTARAGQSTDSGWQMSGSVTLTNPNEYAEGAITADVTAATTVGGGASCVVTGGNDAVVPAAGEDPGTLTLPITCSFTSQPAAAGELQVTATWDPAGEASSASTEASAPVSFGIRSETNKVVDVVDDKTVAGQRVVLETGVTWSAGLVKTYTYDLAVAGGAAGACATYTNTAKVDQPVGTDPTASTTVTACTPPPEVLPVQSFGKALGSVKATCQGTVRTKLDNRSGETVIYKLRVGKKVHKIAVKSLSKKRFTTTGKARAKVVLKVGATTLDKVRIPNLCAPPEVLPETGLRGNAARLAVLTSRWRV